MKNGYRVVLLLPLATMFFSTDAAVDTEAVTSGQRSMVLPLSLGGFAVLCGAGAWYLRRKAKKTLLMDKDHAERVLPAGGVAKGGLKVAADTLSVLAVASVIGAGVAGLKAFTDSPRSPGGAGGLRKKLSDPKSNALVLVEAILSGREELVRDALNPERSFELADGSGRSVFHEIVSRGGAEVLSRMKILGEDHRLVEAAEHCDFSGHTPLMIACREGKFDEVLALMAYVGLDSAGAERISHDGRNALHYLVACEALNGVGLDVADRLRLEQQVAIVATHLINKGCNPNAGVLMLAGEVAEGGVLAAPVPRSMANFDVHVDAMNKASAALLPESREELLRKARSTAAQCQLSLAEGDTPAETCASRGLEYLVDYFNWYSKVDPETEERVSNGRTALMYVASAGDEDGVRDLIAEGGDVLAVDSNGNSALHYVAGLDTGRELEHTREAPSCLEALEYLLDKGCDPYLENGKGETPIDVAEKAGNHYLAARMREHMPTGAAAAVAPAIEAPSEGNRDSLSFLIDLFYEGKKLCGLDISAKVGVPATEEEAALLKDKLRSKFARRNPALGQEEIARAVEKELAARALRSYVASLAQHLTPDELRYRARRLMDIGDPPNPQLVPENLQALLNRMADEKDARGGLSDASSVSDGGDSGGEGEEFELVLSDFDSLGADSSITGQLPPPALIQESGVFHEEEAR